MIKGIGIDIVEVARIEEKLLKNKDFKQHVFSKQEITYCENKKLRFMHFAVRWAAKEAFLKAFGVDFIGNYKLPHIEIRNHPNGKPFIELHDKVKEKFIENKFTTIHVSLSHTIQYATAYVIIE